MITIAGVNFEHPVLNAAGTCKTPEEVRRLAKSPAAAVMVGSITLTARPGNTGDVYWRGESYSLNALGLPNRGMDYYRGVLPEMVRVAQDHAKPLLVSIAGHSSDEYAALAEGVARAGIAAIEVNLGCPNVWEGNGQERIACFDLPYTRTVCLRVAERLALVTAETGHPVPFGVKISPISDPAGLAALAAVLVDVRTQAAEFAFVTASNTFPNALAVDGFGHPLVSVGFGGLSGSAMKPINLGQVKQLRQLLPPELRLIGVGGVSTGRDVIDYRSVGADLVQVATALVDRSKPTVFTDILSDMVTRGSV